MPPRCRSGAIALDGKMMDGPVVDRGRAFWPPELVRFYNA